MEGRERSCYLRTASRLCLHSRCTARKMADVCVRSSHSVQTFQVLFSTPWMPKHSRSDGIHMVGDSHLRGSLNGMREAWLSKPYKQGHVQWLPDRVCEGSHYGPTSGSYIATPLPQNWPFLIVEMLFSYSVHTNDENIDKDYYYFGGQWPLQNIASLKSHIWGLLPDILPSRYLQKKWGKSFYVLSKSKPKRVLLRC